MKSYCLKDWTVLVAGGLLVLALALRLYLYVMGGLHIPVTTDEALTVLQALDVRAGDFPLLLSAQPYMFPLEAYWMAPFVHLLPRTALGMRALVFMEGLVLVALSLLVLRRMGAWRDVWPGVLLVLFPSVYFVMNMTAYSLPHNNSAYILVLVAVWFVLSLRKERVAHPFWMALAGGFFGVLAFSNAMLSLALVVPLGVVAVWNVVRRNGWKQLAGYAVGGALGLLPHVVAIWRLPGAHQSVTASHGWAVAAGRIWSLALTRTLPVTFGWRPCLFPDSAEHLSWGAWGHDLFPYAFSALLLLAAGMALAGLFQRACRHERPFLGGLEWALGASILSILLFALSKRADSGSYRYLGPALVAFPFLVTGVWLVVPRPIKRALGSLVVLVALYNAAVSVRLPLAWTEPGFVDDVVVAPDLKPALAFLREKGIHHAVASHWAAYRIGFEADGAVMCSQPQNERFPGWPIPYKAQVDASSNVAYVLTEKVRFLKPSIFERHLRTMGVEAQVYTAGHFRVYHDFSAPQFAGGQPIERGRFTLHASESPEMAAHLADGDERTFWRSASRQHTNLALEMVFSEPADIRRLVVRHGDFKHDRAPALRIRVRKEHGWETWHEGVPAEDDKFAWRNGHPVYGYAQQTYLLQQEKVQALRLELATADPAWCWTVAEIQLYGP